MDLNILSRPARDVLRSFLNINATVVAGSMIDQEHERLMQEQYAMTHPKSEKDTPSE